MHSENQVPKLGELYDISKKKDYWGAWKNNFGRLVSVSLIGFAGYFGFLSGAITSAYHFRDNSKKLIEPLETKYSIINPVLENKNSEKNSKLEKSLDSFPLELIFTSSLIIGLIGKGISNRKRKKYAEMLDNGLISIPYLAGNANEKIDKNTEK